MCGVFGLGTLCLLILAALRSRNLLACWLKIGKPFGGKAMQQVVIIDVVDKALHQLVQFKTWAYSMTTE